MAAGLEGRASLTGPEGPVSFVSKCENTMNMEREDGQRTLGAVEDLARSLLRTLCNCLVDVVVELRVAQGLDIVVGLNVFLNGLSAVVKVKSA